MSERTVYDEIAEEEGVTISIYLPGFLDGLKNGAEVLKDYIKKFKVDGEDLYITVRMIAEWKR